MATSPPVYTIGHSDHTIEAFIDLLRQHAIALVVDVRSQPYSRWATQYNRELLAHSLHAAGLRYEFLGDVLGGRPADPGLYQPDGEHADYGKIERSPAYQAGIDALLALAHAERTAVVCSEGDHRRCHRHLLISQTLLDRGIRVLHIQPDGTTVEGGSVPSQLSLFE
ncbi:MAG TPA: DUF488 domain-containing protein [Anaerolineae bacterium]|nr:DUF488 domain-containing protein [Anaerolineae bacterium]